MEKTPNKHKKENNIYTKISKQTKQNKSYTFFQ